MGLSSERNERAGLLEPLCFTCHSAQLLSSLRFSSTCSAHNELRARRAPIEAAAAASEKCEKTCSVASLLLAGVLRSHKGAAFDLDAGQLRGAWHNLAH